MAYLFDTDAISELLKPRPAAGYVRWLAAVPREEQFTSAVVVGELYQGAFRSSAVARHLENIEKRVLPAVTVLSYDAAGGARLRRDPSSAGICGPAAGRCRSADRRDRAPPRPGARDGNVKHFTRVPGLRISSALAEARTAPERAAAHTTAGSSGVADHFEVLAAVG